MDISDCCKKEAKRFDPCIDHFYCSKCNKICDVVEDENPPIKGLSDETYIS